MRRLIWVMAFGLLLAFSLGASETSKLIVRYVGLFEKVDLLVNSVKRGELAKDGLFSLELPAEANYKITLQHGKLGETKTVWLASGLERQVVFFGPNPPARGGVSSGSLALLLKGRFDWAEVYLNDQLVGRANRDRAFELELRVGVDYQIRVKRDGHEASTSVRLGSEGEASQKTISLTL